MLQWLIGTGLLLFITAFSLLPSGRKKPVFTTVKACNFLLLSPEQKRLYEALTARGQYVTCGYNEKRVSVPLAMEPFHIAFIPGSKWTIGYSFKSIYLKMKGWKVLAVSPDIMEEKNLNALLEEVERIKSDAYRQFGKAQ